MNDAIGACLAVSLATVLVGLSFNAAVIPLIGPTKETRVASPSDELERLCKDFLGPGRSLPSPPLPGVDPACPHFVSVALKQKAGLGHRLTDFMMALTASALFGVPPAIGEDFDSCSKHEYHGCFAGAEDVLGIAGAVARTKALSAEGIRSTNIDWAPAQFRPADRDWNGRGIGIVASVPGWNPVNSSSCFTVSRLIESWFRDITQSRAILGDLMEAALWKHGGPAGLGLVEFDPASLAVAVHLRYGNLTHLESASAGQSRKIIREKWLQSVMEQISDIAAASGVPVHWYAFTGGPPFSWLVRMPNVTIVGKDVLPPSKVIQNMALADIVVCGTSSLCLTSAWTTKRGLGIAANAREPFDFNTCPTGITCVPDDGWLPSSLKSRLRELMVKWNLRRSLGCNPIWKMRLL